jgi:hypothetical protein
MSKFPLANNPLSILSSGTLLCSSLRPCIYVQRRWDRPTAGVIRANDRACNLLLPVSVAQTHTPHTRRRRGVTPRSWVSSN